MDFMKISTRSVKQGVTEIFPKFILKKSSDLMIRGGDFYAVWREDLGLWSTEEQDVIDMVDQELYKFTEERRKTATDSLVTKYMWDSDSGSIDYQVMKNSFQLCIPQKKGIKLNGQSAPSSRGIQNISRNSWFCMVLQELVNLLS